MEHHKNLDVPAGNTGYTNGLEHCARVEHTAEPETMRNYSIFLHPLLRFVLLGFFCSSLVIFCQVRSSYGQEADITDFTVSNSETHLLLYLTVTDWLTADMEAAIHNGIPITFVFSIELSAVRSNWPDKKIKEYEFNHSLTYDSLKKEYLITRDEKNDNRSTTSLKEADQFMSEINGFKVIPLDELDPQESYIIRAKAKLARKSLPRTFQYLIPFSSPWDFETEWHELTLHLAL